MYDFASKHRLLNGLSPTYQTENSSYLWMTFFLRGWYLKLFMGLFLGRITRFLLSFEVIWIQKNGNITLKEEFLMGEQRNFCKERNPGTICVHQDWEQG